MVLLILSIEKVLGVSLFQNFRLDHIPLTGRYLRIVTVILARNWGISTVLELHELLLSHLLLLLIVGLALYPCSSQRYLQLLSRNSERFLPLSVLSFCICLDFCIRFSVWWPLFWGDLIRKVVISLVRSTHLWRLLLDFGKFVCLN